jgi:glycogen debranching enzyme
VDAAERPGHEHYRRFLTLVRQGTAAGWDQRELARTGRFRVLDAGFSAILARACVDLAHVAERLGEPRLADESRCAGERVAAALRARAGSDGLISAVDAVDDSPLPVTGAASALALLAPGLHERQIAAGRALALDGALASRYGVCSLDRAHPQHSARNYWRGPVWANVTWLTALGLDLHGEARAACTLVERMLLAVDGGGMREYYSPESGRGLGARDFTWTAALFLRARART